ncbi:hypothetical protein [Curtobacterium sp. GC_Cur_3]|uniref:hypothetical protein n=1 Tax=Curtobacterium sp. GC_Cur_3 TaxID=2937372 RepID=UPI0027E12EC5|nr:hypothetical protein [Curtobacterium sp. GC_Cur_3]
MQSPQGTSNRRTSPTSYYCFQVDMTLRVHDLGGRIVEVPIRFRDRIHGVSKMSQAIVVEAMLRTTQWGLQRRFRRRTH